MKKQRFKKSEGLCYYGLTSVPPNNDCRSNPQNLEIWPYLEIVSLQMQLVKMRLYWNGVDLIWSGILIKRWNLDTETDSQGGQMMWRQGEHHENREDWSEAPTSTKDCWWEPGPRKEDFRGSMAPPTPWLWTFGLQNCEISYCFLSHQICGTLFWQMEETNTGLIRKNSNLHLV